jgi:hypothetical protein
MFRLRHNPPGRWNGESETDPLRMRCVRSADQNDEAATQDYANAIDKYILVLLNANSSSTTPSRRLYLPAPSVFPRLARHVQREFPECVANA